MTENMASQAACETDWKILSPISLLIHAIFWEMKLYFFVIIFII